mgnify:CR=1 FL=1|jgi:glycosyltransferase involved in cell wall biosynthesis
MDAELNLLSKKTALVTYAIDASSANKKRRTGVENYARDLIQAMKSHPLVEGERVVLYSPTPLDGKLGEQPEGWSSSVLNWSFSRGWMALRVRWELLRKKPTVLFVPSQAIPKASKKVKIVTAIHDVAFARRPDLYDPKVRKRLKKVTHRALKRSEKVLVPSQATADDLSQIYRAPKEHIVVAPLAPSIQMEQTDFRSTLQHYRLGANFFLTVGRLESKKNITNLIKGFELFKSRRGVGDPFELVLVGEPGFGYEEIKKYLEHSSAKEAIRSLGYVPDDQVAHLMAGATAYTFPSWYEGFGIPNLEAMSAGTALISSDIPAHREVVGDAGILVPPNEAEGWAQAMEKIVRDPAIRQGLIDKGTARAATFSWERTAQQTWEVLRSLV